MIKTDLRWRRLIAAAAKDAARRAADGLQSYPASPAHSMLTLREATELGNEDDLQRSQQNHQTPQPQSHGWLPGGSGQRCCSCLALMGQGNAPGAFARTSK